MVPSSFVRDASLVGGQAGAKKVRVDDKRSRESFLLHCAVSGGFGVRGVFSTPGFIDLEACKSREEGDSQNVSPCVGQLWCRFAGAPRQFGICVLRVSS